MKTLWTMLCRVWRAHPFSPTAFVTRALLIAVLFGISEALGLREYTTFLSGTSANPDLSWQTAAVLGLIHLLLYVAFILLTPISLIAAALLVVTQRWVGPTGMNEVEKDVKVHGGVERSHPGPLPVGEGTTYSAVGGYCISP